MGGRRSVLAAIWGAFCWYRTEWITVDGVASDYHGIFKCIIIIAAVPWMHSVRYKEE